ncbi:MGMT family protein [Porcipelethomonas sp.]|uniref:MGMT family protein n=1 Tax=Porcipelethomonas sp. TaxID=2981675 RepID=UPI003EFA64E1
MKKTVYDYLITIPKGKVVTYGQIAEYLGDKKLSRVVGNILHNNPDEYKYPCYKVVDRNGNLSKHFAFGGIEGQKKKLEEEGIIVENYRVDLDKYQHDNSD